MVVVPVSPSIEREMNIDTKYFSEKYIFAHVRKEWEMGHVMKLNKYPNTVECMNRPAKKTKVGMYQQYSNNLYNYCYTKGQVGLIIISDSVTLYEFFHLLDLWIFCLFSHLVD